MRVPHSNSSKYPVSGWYLYLTCNGSSCIRCFCSSDCRPHLRPLHPRSCPRQFLKTNQDLLANLHVRSICSYTEFSRYVRPWYMIWCCVDGHEAYLRILLQRRPTSPIPITNQTSTPYPSLLFRTGLYLVSPLYSAMISITL